MTREEREEDRRWWENQLRIAREGRPLAEIAAELDAEYDKRRKAEEVGR